MVSAVWSVRHGHCALCGGQTRRLFILEFQHGKPPRLVKKPEDVHTAVCRPCWKQTGRVLLDF